MTEPVELTFDDNSNVGLPTADALRLRLHRSLKPSCGDETAKGDQLRDGAYRKRNPVTMPQLPQKGSATGRFVKPGAAAPRRQNPRLCRLTRCSAAAGAKPQTAGRGETCSRGGRLRIKGGRKEYSAGVPETGIERGLNLLSRLVAAAPASYAASCSEDSRKTARENRRSMGAQRRFQPPLSEARIQTFSLAGRRGFAAPEAHSDVAGAGACSNRVGPFTISLTPVLAPDHEDCATAHSAASSVLRHHRALFTSRAIRFAPDVQQAESLARAYTAKYLKEVASMGREKFVDFIASVLDQQLQADPQMEPEYHNTWRGLPEEPGGNRYSSRSRSLRCLRLGQQQLKRQVRGCRRGSERSSRAAVGSKPLDTS